MKTIEMSNYSVGESCYNEIPGVCEKYNVKKVVLIGGKRALAAAEPRIREAIKETGIIITDSIVYGIAKQGIATLDPSDLGNNSIAPLLDVVLNQVKPYEGNENDD